MTTTLIAITCLQSSTRVKFDAKIEKVLKVFRAPTSASLARIIDPAGLTIYYMYPDKKFAFAKSIVSALMKTGKKVTWLPAMQGDGGMRDPYRDNLRNVLMHIGGTNWHSNSKLMIGKSPSYTYRTLFVQDIKAAHPGVSFYDINRFDPKISEMREFETAVILGFSRGSKLRILGFDAWKD